MERLSPNRSQPKAALYVALLGNDPGPVYQGLKLLQSRVGKVQKILLYAQEPEKGFERKRQGLLNLLGKTGIPCTYKKIPNEPRPEVLSGESLEALSLDATEVWVNLTGGAKAWAAILFKKWKDSKAKFFIIESHRPFKAPQVVFLEEGLAETLKEEESLSLEDYRRLYLEPEGVNGEEKDFSVEANRSKALASLRRLFRTSGYLPSRLFRLKNSQVEEFFVVHLGRPYLCRDYLDDQKKEMRQEDFAEFSERAKKLGGQLCMPLVPIHKEYLQERHKNERENLLSRWRDFAKQHNVRLLEDLLKSAYASAQGHKSFLTEQTGSAPSEDPPSSRSTLLLANVSDQVVPLYAAYLSFRPQEVYLVSTPEKKEKLDYARLFFQEKRMGVSTHLVSSPHALGEVEQYFSKVLSAYEGETERVHVNLNGGTTAMALGLYRASWDKGKAHYLEGDTLYFLEGGSREVPWKEGEPEELLFLNGYRLEGKKDWKGPPDRDLLEKAKGFIEKWRSKTGADEDLERERRAFEQRWLNRYGTPFIDEQQKELSNFFGALLEYVVFAHLYDLLEGKVRPGGYLVSLNTTQRSKNLASQSIEVDGLAYHRGTLWLVECKAVFRGKGLPKRGTVLSSVGEQIWGREVRALIVALNWTSQFSEETPSVRGAVYMAKHGSEGAKAPGGGRVYRFPEELPQAMGL